MSPCGSPFEGRNRKNRSSCPGATERLRPIQVEVVVDDERRVIGKAPALVDSCGARRRGDARRRDLVVDAPTHVIRPGLPAIRPPGVLPRLLVETAENVDETQFVKYAAQPRAFLGQESRVLLVAAPILEVDRLVRDVPVAAEDDLASGFSQLLQVRQERSKEAEFGLLSRRRARA